MNPPRNVYLVGAGLAGSLLAIYLARRGLQVTVFERRADLRHMEISAGRSINLALSNRGLRALAGVGLDRVTRDLLIPMRGRMLHQADGELQLQPYGKDETEVIYSISRGGLNSMLMDAAEATSGVRFLFDHRVEAVDFENGALRVLDKSRDRHFDTGPGPVIATDGASSRIRRALCERPGFEATEDYLPHDYKELEIPPGPGGKHRIEAHALHIWPRGGHMLIALPNLDGSFTVTLFLAREGPESFATLLAPDDVRTFFQSNFPDAVALMPRLAQEFFDNPTGRMGTVRCARWHNGGNLLLLGDAAHAIVPFHGQGMNAAFEDCTALDACIETHGLDWEKVFPAFEQARKANAEAIADMALENYIEMRDLVRDPRFHLQKKIAWELERRLPRRFVPRYSQVMFHHIPYSEAQRRGAIQKTILEQLSGTATSLEEVDLDAGERLVRELLEPIPEAWLQARAT